jgi:hypothetical protein
MLITAACVAFNEYALGYKSLLAANIAQFIFGQGLGTVFRFWAMHMWVFPEARLDEIGAEASAREFDKAPPHPDQDENPDAAALVDSRC